MLADAVPGRPDLDDVDVALGDVGLGFRSYLGGGERAGEAGALNQ